MARYGKHGEQTYRQNFNRKKKDCIDWLLLNLSLARRVLDMDGLLAIAIDPCYISKVKVGVKNLLLKTDVERAMAVRAAKGL